MSFDYNKNHPELGDGEVFITNSNALNYSVVGWKTKRKGKIAYTQSGNKIVDTVDWFPVFAKREEVLSFSEDVFDRLKSNAS